MHQNYSAEIVSWKATASENENRGSELYRWRARALFLALSAFVVLFALAYTEGHAAEQQDSNLGRYSFLWQGSPHALSEIRAQGSSLKQLTAAATPGSTSGSTKGAASTNKLYSECLSPAFGHDCPGPRGHDHGWMRHEQDCIDASKWDWDYQVQNKTSTGVLIGTLKDPRSGLCLATRQAPYLGSMWLDDCKPDDRTQLWSKTIHMNHVVGFGYGESDVTEYFNAADGAAVDINCQGKCFRQKVCTNSKLYKLWVHDSDVPPIPFPDKIPDDPLAPI